jgi:hypothetical protein
MTNIMFLKCFTIIVPWQRHGFMNNTQQVVIFLEHVCLELCDNLSTNMAYNYAFKTLIRNKDVPTL